MVVVTYGGVAVIGRRPAQPETGLSVTPVDHISPTQLRQQVQVAVHRRQASRLVPPADLVVDLLRGAEPVRIAEDLLDDNCLP
jgi:hypothetical protein